VNGSDCYQRFNELESSTLRQILLRSKFYQGKPDQSDASTFWLLTEQFGPTLATYSHDGVLDQTTEEHARDRFLENGHTILGDLLLRPPFASQGGAFPPDFIAQRFTYVNRFLNGKYSIYAPYKAYNAMRNAEGTGFAERYCRAGQPPSQSRAPAAWDRMS
jgi:hypothetical protein